jgi:hypothetical protein
MIIRDALKYQHYGPGMPEVLFDLSRNPEETESFIDDSGYATEVAAFRRRFASFGHELPQWSGTRPLEGDRNGCKSLSEKIICRTGEYPVISRRSAAG